MPGDPRAFLDDDAAIPLAAGDRADLREPLQPDVEERIHHRGDQQLAARVLLLIFRHVHVVLAGRELDRAAQRLAAHGRELGAHLLRQAEQHRLRAVPRASRYLAAMSLPSPRALRSSSAPDHIGQRKHRQQRHDVGEALVERRLVGRRRLQIAPAQAVEDRVRRLVRDDVVRQAGVDRLAARPREVTEEYSPVVPGIERVGVREGVRGDVNLVAVRAPWNAPAEREFELRQRSHDDRIDVLRVELWIVEQPLVVAFRSPFRLLHSRAEAKRSSMWPSGSAS